MWFVLATTLLVFSPLLEGGTTHFAVMVIRLLILSLFGWYILGGVAGGKLEYAFPRGSLVTGLYLLVATASTWFSPYVHQSLQWLIVLTSYAILLYLFVFFVNEWDHVKKLLLIVVGLAAAEAISAMFQWWLGSARPSGTFFNPNFLAGYVAVGWILALAGLCYLPVQWKGKFSSKVPQFAWSGFSLIILILLAAGIIVTGSRAGLMSLLVGTGLVLCLRFGRRGVGIVLLLVALAMLVPNPVRDRVLTEHRYNPVTYARWGMWKSAMRQIQDHPFGVGLGLHQYTFPRYSFPVEGEITRYTKVAQTPHSEYLQMGVEMGIVSLTLFVCGIVIAAREAAWILRQRLRRWQRGLIVGATGGAVVILTHAAVDSNLHEPALAILFALCTAIILAGRKLVRHFRQAPQSVSLQPRWMWGGLAVVAVVIIAASVVRIGLAGSYYEKGDYAFVQSKYAEAIESYAGAVALDPSKAMYHSALAKMFYQVYKRGGGLEAAHSTIAELQVAMALNPLDGRIPGELGRVFFSLASVYIPHDTLKASPSEEQAKWLRRAEGVFCEATQLEPFTVSYRFELGEVYLAMGETIQATGAFQKVVELEPNFLPAREWLARLSLRQGRYEDAMQEYLEIIERQRRYSASPKSLLEQRFLKADAVSLWTALGKVRLRT